MMTLVLYLLIVIKVFGMPNDIVTKESEKYVKEFYTINNWNERTHTHPLHKYIVRVENAETAKAIN